MEEHGAGAKSLGAVVGRNVQGLRVEQNLTQQELVQRFEDWGLSWARSKLAALEGGKRPRVDLEELLLIAASLQCSLLDLVGGSDDITLGRHGTGLKSASVRGAFEGSRHWVADVQCAPRGNSYEQWARYQNMFAAGEADRALAKRLGVPVDRIVEAAASLFGGRTLTQERDAQLHDAVSVRERAAHRGHITRRLSRLVEDEIRGVTPAQPEAAE